MKKISKPLILSFLTAIILSIIAHIVIWNISGDMKKSQQVKHVKSENDEQLSEEKLQGKKIIDRKKTQANLRNF